MKKTKCVALSLFMLAVIVFLGSCNDDDPEPKAADPTEKIALTSDYGSIEGTISGQRNDDTKFSEAFKYNLGYSKGLLETRPSGDQSLSMDLYGSDANNRISFSLKYDKKKVVTMDVSSYISLSFFKEMQNNTAFKVEVETVENSVDLVWPVNPTLNDATYHFVFPDVGPYGIYYDQDDNGNWLFETKDGSTVLFDNYMGNFVSIEKPNGTIEYSSVLYGDLTFDYDYTVSEYCFFDGDGTNLSTKQTIPADHMDVSNFSFDEATGSMKFDFVLQVQSKARYLYNNSTQHPMTITGKADILVYTDVLSRTRN